MQVRKLPAVAVVGVIAFTLLSLATPAFSATYYVDAARPDDSGDGASWATAKKTISAAMAVVGLTSGDQIWVAKGTYTERVMLPIGVEMYGGFAGTETAVSQRPAFPRTEGDLNNSVIDGDQGGSVVTTPTGASYDPSSGKGTIIDGFTIRNGKAQYGGGVNCSWKSAPLIRNNIITSNTATQSGGGIYCWQASSPTILDNLITNNSASAVDGSGGGIYADTNSQPWIGEDFMGNLGPNTLTKNRATYGGGLDCYWVSSGAIVYNTISDNVGTYGGGVFYGYSQPAFAVNTVYGNHGRYGGGIYCYGSLHSWSEVVTNKVMANTAQYGGGIYLEDASLDYFFNNTILANGAQYGGGVYVHESSPNITNNTIVGNGATIDGGGLYFASGRAKVYNNIVAFGNSGIFAANGATPELNSNCVYGNSRTHLYDGSYDYQGVSAGSGDINVSPRLVLEPYGEVHLMYNLDANIISPCVDAGNNSAPGRPTRDMDGEPRIAGDEVDPETPPVGAIIPGKAQPPSPSRIDIGADEVYVTAVDATPPDDQWPEGVTPVPFWIYLYTQWQGGYRSLCVAPDGDDMDEGTTWGTAKATLQSAVDAALAPPTVTYGDAVPRTDLFPYVGDYPFGDPYPTTDWVYQVLNASEYGGQIRVKGDAAHPYFQNLHLGPYVYMMGGYPTGVASPGSSLRDWRNNPTILDGQASGSTVDFFSGFDYNLFDGFVVQNGIGTLDDYGNRLGGGIFCNYSYPVIVNSAIMSNVATYGGGIGALNGSPWIFDTAVSLNSATATDAGGGGLYTYSGSPVTWSSAFVGNSASFGGAIDAVDGSTPWIINTTITSNSATNGGGVHLDSSSPNFVNSIVAFNTSGIMANGGTPRFDYNCIYGNRDYDFLGVTNPTGMSGNISEDPLLAITPTNVHIQPHSPCRDAGTNYIDGWLILGWSDKGTGNTYMNVDMDFQSRIQPDAGVMDMGSDESDGTTWSTLHKVVRVSSSGSDSNDGSTWALAMKNVQTAVDAASGEGGEVWVAAGTYNERITIPAGVFVYGGFAGGETSRQQRNPAANSSALDATGLPGQGSVVTITDTGFNLCGIDGVTITGGTGTLVNGALVGGGVYCANAAPVISGNTITANTADNGAGIYCNQVSGTISSNIIMNNDAATTAPNGLGGGIRCEAFSSPRIVNNTIVYNSGVNCGGISCSSSSPLIANNIIAFGSSGIRSGSGGTVSLFNNCVFGNTNYDYWGVAAGATDISEDPLFVDAANGDYHIQPLSPCVDGGDDTEIGLNWLDIDGQPRLADTHVDIGADECHHVALPAFTPDGGHYTSTQHVTITCATPGAVIHYTTNGVDPTQADPVVTTPIVVDRNLTLKAKAWRNGLVPSGVKSADYGIALAQPVFSPDGGTYDYAVDVTVTCVSPGATIHYTTNGVDPTEADPAIASGESVLIYKTATLKACAFRTGWDPSPVKSADYTITCVALPTFTPDGGTYGTAQSVVIACDTPGATIHYTINGKDPTEADPVIASGASVVVDRSLTLKAKAWKPDQTESGVKTGVYTITGTHIIYVKPTGDDSNNGLSWDLAKKSVQVALNAAVSGDDVWVAKGTYVGGVTLRSGVGLYGGFDGTETSRDERDWRTNVTILDGNKAGSVVVGPANAVATTVIDGFTIRNGIGRLVEPSRYGGGIYCSSSSPTIANVIISGNSADYGGGIYCRNSSPIVVNSVITGNTAQIDGGGVAGYSASPSIANSTIADNKAVSGGGGAVYVSGTSSRASLTNTIAAFNSSGILRYSGAAIDLDCNCVYGNGPYNYSGLDAGPKDIVVDPEFLDAANGDYHITAISPCKDAGDDGAVEPGAFDIDVQPRIYGSHVDIGADEWQPSRPVNVSLSPNKGSLSVGTKMTFTSVYSDADGYTDLSGCLLLLNTKFTGNNALYIYYQNTTGKLWIRDDANTAWQGGFKLGSDNILENSYCKLYCAETTVSGSGAKFTVNWRVELKPTMANKTLFAWMLVIDKNGVRGGWDRLGSFTASRAPMNISVTPSSGWVEAGSPRTITSKYYDPDGYADIAHCYILMNDVFTGTKAVYAHYDARANKLYVRDDANTKWIGGYAPGSANVLENSYFKLYCADTTVTGSGTSLSVNWRVEMKPTMLGKICGFWMRVDDNAGMLDNWQRMGSLSVSQTPVNVSVSPNSGSITANVKQTITSVYSDAEGYANLADCVFLMNTVFTGTKAVYIRYNANTNKLYVRDDANTTWGVGYAPGSTEVLENSYCKLYCAETTVNGSGNTLTVNWRLLIKSPLAGKTCPVWMRVYDDANAIDGWDPMGSLTIQ